jgi:hypothetical protein
VTIVSGARRGRTELFTTMSSGGLACSEKHAIIAFFADCSSRFQIADAARPQRLSQLVIERDSVKSGACESSNWQQNKICIRCLTRRAKAIDNLASVLIAAAANEGIARSGLRQMFFKN